MKTILELEDLRIGDWVYHSNLGQYFQISVAYIQHSDEFVTVLALKSSGGKRNLTDDDFQYLEPIEIDDKFLKLNGFGYGNYSFESGPYKVVYSLEKHSLTIYKKSDIKGEVTVASFSNVKYVSELQHLMKDLNFEKDFTVW